MLPPYFIRQVNIFQYLYSVFVCRKSCDCQITRPQDVSKCLFWGRSVCVHGSRARDIQGLLACRCVLCMREYARLAFQTVLLLRLLSSCRHAYWRGPPLEARRKRLTNAAISWTRIVKIPFSSYHSLRESTLFPYLLVSNGMFNGINPEPVDSPCCPKLVP
jgi:hypothetical protein